LVRCDAVHEHYIGGWSKFTSDAPNGTFCSDNEIARIGFMTPDDVEAHIDRLKCQGLRFIVNGQSIDIAVADQQRGLTAPCDWLEFGRVNLGSSGASVACCRLVGSKSMQIFTPEGWKFEGSLSDNFGFCPSETAEKRLNFLRRESEVDVYYDSLAGKEVYIGQTKK